MIITRKFSGYETSMKSSGFERMLIPTDSDLNLSESRRKHICNLLPARESKIEIDISRRGAGQLHDCGHARFILAHVTDEPSNHPVTMSSVSLRSFDSSLA
jgi:hypothetical protein